MNLSFWEKEVWFRELDYVVVGAGIVGLNAAMRLKSQTPSARVAILERGFLPTGASTKNAGFACFGSPSEILADLRGHNEGEVKELLLQRFQGLELLKRNLGSEAIQYQLNGGFELFRKGDEKLYDTCVKHLSYLNDLCNEAIGLKETFRLASNDFGFENVAGMLVNKYEGQIHTGMMMANLLAKVKALGVEVFHGFSVEDINSEQEGLVITEKSGVKIHASKVIIATNGFAKRLLDEDIIPARAQVLITKPIDGLKVRGTFHMDEGYYYFRNIGNRILFGGGRNLDIEGETTTKMEVTDVIMQELNKLLIEVILPNTGFEIESSWAGIMGVGQKKKAIVKKLRPNLYCAVRLGGMGIAIGSQIGFNVADLALTD